VFTFTPERVFAIAGMRTFGSTTALRLAAAVLGDVNRPWEYRRGVEGRREQALELGEFLAQLLAEFRKGVAHS
jgi:hypothetical protein